MWQNPVLVPGATELRRYAALDDDGVALGYLEAHLGGVSNDAAMIARLIVRPSLRRCGIGARFVRAALADLQRDGYESFSLFVLKQNAKAIRFYRTLGFRSCLGPEFENALLLVTVYGKFHD